MSSSSELRKRLESLKNRPTAPESLATSQGATKASVAVAKTTALVAESASKVEAAKPTSAPVAPTEIKRLIENISELELSEDIKSVSGFNHQAFEARLHELNTLQDQSFPEINRALIEINKDLRNHPELAHMLSPAQQAVIVRRILHDKHLYIAPVKEKKPPKKNAALGTKYSAEIEDLVAGATGSVEIDASEL